MNTSEEMLRKALPRYHVDREVSGKVRYNGVRLFAVKGVFAVAVVGAVQLLIYLQDHMLDNATLTCGIVVFCIACLIGFCFYSPVPRIDCSGCKQRMKHEYIEQADTEVLICRSCKTYADLHVSHNSE